MIHQNNCLNYTSSPSKSQPDTQQEENALTATPTPHQSSHQPHSPLPSKVKSSLCKHFTLYGACPYGLKCQFAHGQQQLRCKAVTNLCYKTKTCFSFANKGSCEYGDRCNFVHLRQHKEISPQIILQNFPELAILWSSNKQHSNLISLLYNN